MITINPASILLAIMIWTVFAAGTVFFVKFARKTNPLLRYHIATATLIGLPLGLIMSLFMTAPAWMLSGPGTIQLVQNSMPSVMLNEIVIGGGAVTSAAQESVGSSLSAATIALYGLFIMMALGLTRLIFLYASLKNQLRRASLVENEQVNEAFDSIKRNLALPGKVKLFRMDEANIPFTAGFRNPVIVLPTRAIEECTPEQTRLILMHESVHISRLDYLFHSFELMVRHLFWMHPLVHVLYRQATVMREMACDQEVMREDSGNVDEYAQILCQFALKPGSAPVFKAAMAHEHHLLTRIRQLSTLQTPNKQKVTTMKSSILMAAAALLLITGAMACSDLAQNPDTETVVLGMDDEIEVRGQTYTVQQFRDSVAATRDDLNRALEENANSEHAESIRETRDLYANVLMLIDNGQAGRAAQLYAESMPSPGDKTESDFEVFMVVEEMPQMVGGQMALYEALTYPEMARRGGIEGRVIMQFIVNEDGSVSDMDIVRSAGAGGLDEAAIEAMSQMEFTPGIQRGRAVKVQMTQPVIFRLNSDSE
ncbi:MAG: M56 family metallopeptidase [Balneolia bacterium]|nr:M56 family metallopeptidase [Balneolia bacterium]